MLYRCSYRYGPASLEPGFFSWNISVIFSWDILVICVTVVMKLAHNSVFSLYFQTFWPKCLCFSVISKTFLSMTEKKSSLEQRYIGRVIRKSQIITTVSSTNIQPSTPLALMNQLCTVFLLIIRQARLAYLL